jgi:hypothetical protein
MDKRQIHSDGEAYHRGFSVVVVIHGVIDVVGFVEEEKGTVTMKNMNKGENRANTFPQNIIIRLMVHDLTAWGFRGFLPWTAVHAVARIRKTRK